MRTTITLVIASLIGSTAHADEPTTVDNTTVPQGETISYTADASYVDGAGVAKEWMILPEGQILGAELKLITSKPSLGTEPIEFSDVAILALHVKTSVFGKAELSGSVDLLPKQPSWTDEKIWQGASLGVRGQLGRHQVAVGAKAAAGPMLGDLGYWGTAGAIVDARKRLHDIITFEGEAGGSMTYLLPSSSMRDPAWLVEAGVSGSVLFRDPNGNVGGWVGVGYALPVSHKGRDPVSDASLDPQPRLDLHIGGVVAVVDDWDLFADYSVIDRGDMSAMATRLPILDGGFDQRQLVLGINYHVKKKSELSAAALIQE